MTTTFTQFLRLAKPDFRSGPWADDVNLNADKLDSAIANSAIAGNIVVWKNATAFTVGKIAIDTAASPASYWICALDHVSNTAPTTFAQDRASRPGNWTSITFGIKPRGAWARNTAYAFYDIAYDSVLGIVGLCLVPHTSPNSGSINTTGEVENWVLIVNLPAVGTTPASLVSYDDTISMLPGTPTNVQSALVAVDARIDAAAVIVSAQAVTMAALSVNDTAQNSLIAGNSSSINTLQTSVTLLQSNDTNQTNRLNTIDAEIAALGSGFPATTAMLFWQAAAPTGWTKSVVHNDKTLRVVSGTGGGNGGTVAFSTVFAQSATGGHAISIAEMAAHTHSLDGYVPAGSGAAAAPAETTSANVGVDIHTTFATTSQGSGTAHTHPMDIRVQYLDLIICTKN